MGISPTEAKKMSLWEMAIVADRWIEAHDSGDSKGKLDEGEKDEIWEWMQQRPAVPLTLRQARKATNGRGH